MRRLSSLIIIITAVYKLASAAFGPRFRTRKRVIIENGVKREQVVQQEVYSKFQQWAARVFLVLLCIGVAALWYATLHPQFPQIR